MGCCHNPLALLTMHQLDDLGLFVRMPSELQTRCKEIEAGTIVLGPWQPP